ncbi:MAG: hypothetical protein ACXWC7_02645 [Chitinophagaceae bacterium]
MALWNVYHTSTIKTCPKEKYRGKDPSNVSLWILMLTGNEYTECLYSPHDLLNGKPFIV